MTISVTAFCRSASRTLAIGAALLAIPAAAQQDVTDQSVDAVDVGLTPLADLNLARDPIPAILVHAKRNPYANAGIASCEELLVKIGDLDAVLGDDVDTTPPEERELTPGGVAQSVVGMLIPFRGLIREVSGANEHEYEFRTAIVAGMMRRAYLKGLGEERGCPYPARPMDPNMLARLQRGEPTLEAETVQAGDGTQFVSRPVIQQTD